MNEPVRRENAFTATETACGTCGAPFMPTRAWSTFCNDRCRSAFNRSKARVEAAKEAGPRMYEALERIARETGTPAAALAAEAIKGLKPLESPKALLEKARA